MNSASRRALSNWRPRSGAPQRLSAACRLHVVLNHNLLLNCCPRECHKGFVRYHHITYSIAMVFGLFSRKPIQILEPPVEEQQLRTPSPSTIQRDASPFPLVEDSGPVLDQSELYNLIRSVPAKTLYDYSLSRLRPSSPAPTADGSLPPQTLAGLTAFFSSLTPPPTLHCVRCHKFYMDVENDDRACRVSHDDDSAEVDRHETLWECCGKTVEGDGDMGPPDGWCYEGMHTVGLTHPEV